MPEPVSRDERAEESECVSGIYEHPRYVDPSHLSTEHDRQTVHAQLRALVARGRGVPDGTVLQ